MGNVSGQHDPDGASSRKNPDLELAAVHRTVDVEPDHHLQKEFSYLVRKGHTEPDAHFLG